MELKDESADGRGLDNMTSHDHSRTMIIVRVAQLKAKLSEYLRLVRSGQTVTVFDRDTPIARIVPTDPKAGHLPSRKPKGSVSFWRVPRPPPYRGKIDIVELLLEERQVDR